MFLFCFNLSLSLSLLSWHLSEPARICGSQSLVSLDRNLSLSTKISLSLVAPSTFPQFITCYVLPITWILNFSNFPNSISRLCWYDWINCCCFQLGFCGGGESEIREGEIQSHWFSEFFVFACFDLIESKSICIFDCSLLMCNWKLKLNVYTSCTPTVW